MRVKQNNKQHTWTISPRFNVLCICHIDIEAFIVFDCWRWFPVLDEAPVAGLFWLVVDEATDGGRLVCTDVCWVFLSITKYITVVGLVNLAYFYMLFLGCITLQFVSSVCLVKAVVFKGSLLTAAHLAPVWILPS